MSRRPYPRWPRGIVFPEVTDDHVGRLCAQGRCYEANLLRDIRWRTCRLAIDVGAHIGVHTIWLAGVCGFNVIAFEPTHATAEKLRANVAANSLSPYVIVEEKALGCAAGTGHMEIRSDTNVGMNRLALCDDGPVEVVTLDSLALAPALIKIDVEGMQMDVLEGAQNTIQTHRPLLYVEGDVKLLDRWMGARGYERFGRFAVTPVYGYRPR